MKATQAPPSSEIDVAMRHISWTPRRSSYSIERNRVLEPAKFLYWTASCLPCFTAVSTEEWLIYRI